MGFLIASYKKINCWYIFLLNMLFFLCSFVIVGIIPINNGTGWDGNVYYDIINNIITNGWIITDPYRTIRLTAFPQLLLLRELGIDKQELVLFQFLINSLLLSLANVALYQSIINLDLGKQKALAASFAFFFTWPVIVMVPFYPVLGDHMALALSCFSLWCWTRNSRFLLMLITFYSVWVFPPLFIIPVILLALPKKDATFPPKKIIKHSSIISIFLAILISVTLTYVIKANDYLLELPTHALDHSHNKSSSLTTIAWLTGVSLTFCVLMVFIYCFTLVRLINNTTFWYGIDMRYSIAALAISVISFYLMRCLIDFSHGFAGPPLIKNLILQCLSAPGKSIVAHFLYFGPMFPVVYYNICKKKSLKSPVAITAILIAFMLPMIFGSESRQWIVAFPMVIVSAMFLSWGPAKALIIGLFTMIVLLPMLVLKFSIQEAVRLNDGLQDSSWQAYFIYQGPWMNTSAYKIAMTMLIIFAIAYYIASYIDRQLTKNSQA